MAKDAMLDMIWRTNQSYQGFLEMIYCKKKTQTLQKRKKIWNKRSPKLDVEWRFGRVLHFRDVEWRLGRTTKYNTKKMKKKKKKKN